MAIHLFKTYYEFAKNSRRHFIEFHVDEEAFKASGYTTEDDFVANIPEDTDLKAVEIHFSLYYLVLKPKLIEILKGMNISGYCNFIFFDRDSKSVYLYLIYKESKKT